MRRFFKPGLPLFLLLAACEAAVTPNAYQDYTPPRVVAMYPAADTLYAYTNTAFYVQFDDRMDPAIAAYDSDALILENISVIPPQRIPLTFQLVNADSCLLASFDPKSVRTDHVYMLRMTGRMRNFSRMALPAAQALDRCFLFEGMLPETAAAFTQTSHSDGSWGGREIRLSGTCSGIETIRVFFAEYPEETVQTFRLPYGSTTWSAAYQIDTTLFHEESYKLAFSAAPYASYRRLQQEVTVKLDLTPPEFCVIWPFCNGSLVSNTTTLYGYVVDNNAVDRLMVRVGTNGWQLAAGKLDWSLPLDTTALSNGPVTLHFAALDVAGNSNYTAIGVVVTNQ